MTLFHFPDVSEAWVHGGRAAPRSTVYVRVTGAKTGAIKLSNNWCPAPGRVVAVDQDVPAGGVGIE